MDAPYTIEKISPTKMKGNVYAHAIVRFGAAWVRFRVVKSENGLFVTPPANPCKGAGGRTFYKRSADVDDLTIREKLSEDILAALEKHLANVKAATCPSRSRASHGLLTVSVKRWKPSSK